MANEKKPLLPKLDPNSLKSSIVTCPNKMGLLFKEKLLPIVDTTNSSMNLASVIIYLLTIAAPSTIYRDDCPITTESYWKDTAKVTFLGMVLSWMTISTAKKFLVKKYFGENTSNRLEFLESEMVDVLETITFVLLLSEAFPIYTSLALATPAFFRSIFILYKAFGNPEKESKIMNLIYMPFTLGSAIPVLSSLLLNIFYNTTHKKSWSGESYLTAALTASGALLGFSCAYIGGKALQFGRGLEAANNMLFFWLSSLLSTIDCANPNIMNGKGFTNGGWGIAVFLLGFSLLPAIRAGYVFTQENPNFSNTGLQESIRGITHRFIKKSPVEIEEVESLKINSSNSQSKNTCWNFWNFMRGDTSTDPDYKSWGERLKNCFGQSHS